MKFEIQELESRYASLTQQVLQTDQQLRTAATANVVTVANIKLPPIRFMRQKFSKRSSF